MIRVLLSVICLSFMLQGCELLNFAEKKYSNKSDYINECEHQLIRYQRNIGANHDELVACTKKHARFGDIKAQEVLATMYYFGNTSLALDVSEAFAWYTQAAEAGSAVAQQQLGLMYKRGEGVTKDYHEAYYWLKQAANQNEGSAIYELAKLYEEGKGVPQNFKKAYEWFEKSAYLGNPAAQLQLAQIFLKEDTLKNRKLAYVWSSIAATNGSNSAINFRDSIELEPKMKREAQAQAEDLYKKIKEEQKLALKIQ